MEKKSRVLIAEDDRAILRMYMDFLQADDYDVVGVTSAEDALELLVKGEHFDLVLTDIMMAKMDGWEFLNVIRQNLKLDELKLPVIVISAHFDSTTLRAKAFERGANGSYCKNEPLSKLMHDVRIQTGRVRSKFSDDSDTGTD